VNTFRQHLARRSRMVQRMHPERWLAVEFDVDGDPQGKARARAVPGADPLRSLALTHLDDALRDVHRHTTTSASDHIGQAIQCLRKSKPTARMRKPEKTRAYEKRIGEAFDIALLQEHRDLYHDWKPHDGPVALYFIATFAIPPSWPKWRQEAARHTAWFMAAPPDKDNVEKAIADGLDGVAYRRDAQVWYGQQWKLYGDAPGLFVRVEFYRQITFAGWKAMRGGLAGGPDGEG